MPQKEYIFYTGNLGEGLFSREKKKIGTVEYINFIGYKPTFYGIKPSGYPYTM